MLASRTLVEPPVSIVIPTLDEEKALAATLTASTRSGAEVIVSDGGSRDGTLEVARRHGARIVQGEAGRGPQLGRGAEESNGDILIFLHADTILPPDALDSVRLVIGGGAVGGGFMIRFDVAGRILRLGAHLINLRTRLTRAPLGDQAQFASREAYMAIGGFQPWPILEDLDFIRRLKRHGELALLPGPVTTASRRFRTRGVVRTVATNWSIWALYFVGVPPERLSRLYRDSR